MKLSMAAKKRREAYTFILTWIYLFAYCMWVSAFIQYYFKF